MNALKAWYFGLEPRERWIVSVGAVAAVIILAVLLQGAEFWQLRRTNAALEAVVAPACQRVVGDSSISGCQREVRRRLGLKANSATEDFLSTLAAIATARDPEMRMDMLSYRNRAMNLQVIAPNTGAVAEFADELQQTRRFAVEIEANNPIDGGGTEGRLRIVGANP